MLTSSTSLGAIWDPLVNYIQGKAQSGAEAAIPEIEQKVKDTVMPILMPVIFMTAGSLLISLLAYREARRARSGKALTGSSTIGTNREGLTWEQWRDAAKFAAPKTSIHPELIKAWIRAWRRGVDPTEVGRR